MRQFSHSPTTIQLAPDIPLAAPRPRARVGGKFFYAGDEKLYLRGVTYGTFRPDRAGSEYGIPDRVDEDFRAMSRNGINAVRLYTVPPRWLLDLAALHGLYVMVGLPWEQHVAFLDGGKPGDIERRIRQGVLECAGHPAVLCFAIGNEIPSSMVRWYGPRRVERFLHRLYRAARQEDPEALVTYVNYPTTEYLDLSFLDFVSFNVYLEAQDRLEAYLARLHSLAGDRPLIMAEIGLDSRRNGTQAQADTLVWQVDTTFKQGCAGAFVFSWTDEWHRGGHDVEDWDFGLTDRARRPKPALAAVRQAYGSVPFADPGEAPLPCVSVVLCSYNGAATLRDCCEGLLRLDYPDYEVILVDDGSTDGTAGIGQEYGFSVISTPNLGLSNARNVGLKAARGQIVAYTDDDAWPDPQWLRYLVDAFRRTGCAAVGGPNILPLASSSVAQCVENAPGGPVHVLLSDTEAEHIPGCNMAFLRSALLAVGGFDPTYRAAGDDVDICWKIQAHGWKIGFHPAAVVWHHRRNTVRAYWRQQVGYGRAEALLERKWPEKYNAAGHLTWAGRLYGSGMLQTLGPRRGRIYGGIWGSAPFQSVYSPAPGGVLSLSLMPEWYLLVLGLGLLTALGLSWPPLLVALPLLLAALAAPIVRAGLGGARAHFPAQGGQPGSAQGSPLRLIVLWLHLLQPLARLVGRFGRGLTPWRPRGAARLRPTLRISRQEAVWRETETWQPTTTWLEEIEGVVGAAGGWVLRGGDFDQWDLEVRPGMLGVARLRMGLEEHGDGRQLARFRIGARLTGAAAPLILVPAVLSVGAASAGAVVAAGVLCGASLLLAGRAAYECGAAVSTLVWAVRELPGVRLGSGSGVARRGATAERGLSQGWGLYRLLGHYARPLWKGWLGILLLTLLSTGLSLLQPWPLKVVVDNVLGGTPLQGFSAALSARLPGADTQEGLLAWAAAAGVLVFLLGAVLDALLTSRWVRTGQGMVYNLARDLFARVQRRSLLFHSRNSVGDSMSRIATDAWVVHTAADNLLFAPAHAIFTLIATVAVMATMSPSLSLLSLVVAPFMVVAALPFRERIRSASRARRRVDSMLQTHVQRTLSSISVVQAFAREKHEGQRFSEFASSSIRARQRSMVASSLFNLGSGLAGALGTALIIWAGAGQVLAGTLSVGSLLVFITYLVTVQAQFRTLAGVYRSVQEAAGSAERVAEVLAAGDEVVSPAGAPHLVCAGGRLHLRDVTFAYAEQPILRGLSLSVEPGGTLAILGRTGAGKSTLAGLIARLYDPQEGSVEIDGQDLRTLDLGSVRSAVAVALQEPVLFPATVAENIGYGRPGATQEEIVAAARAACAHEFIERLPQGYGTRLGARGATLSGGERQRIAIARALLKDAPILILDEPTSALDPETERRLFQSMGRLRRGKTTIVITHRLSAALFADRIAVLDDGRLAEEGTYEDLISREGMYRRLQALRSSGPAEGAAR